MAGLQVAVTLPGEIFCDCPIRLIDDWGRAFGMHWGEAGQRGLAEGP